MILVSFSKWELGLNNHMFLDWNYFFKKSVCLIFITK